LHHLRQQLAIVALTCSCATLGERPNSQTGGAVAEVGASISRNDVPIVLLHGMAGFDQVGGYEYFYKVPEALAADGRRVFATEVDPFNTVAHRAEQLSPQLDDILAKTGATQVDIIAHSQGGLDARYLVSQLGYGDRVRTIVTIATPNHGTLIADATLGWVPDMPTEASAAFNLMDWLGAHATGTDVDLQAQVWGMSRRYVEGTFNPSTHDDPRVRYYSYAGSTQASPFVDRDTTDIVNPGLLAGYLVLKTLEGDNDGLVSVASASWGSFLGVLPADHMDEVGQPFGATSRSFDHIAFYRALARFLAGQGPAPTY
jgi:triacylglycerol esterase/lipase EstA (alpha/beta hydrolase family)